MKLLYALALTASLMATAGCAQATPSSLEKAEVESIIKEYLMKNPEIVQEALNELDRKIEREAIQNVYYSIDSRDVIVGPEDAKVTIIEFFDYNCGFCKRSTDWVNETLKKHPKDVKVVFKELPILDGRTGTSRLAAKAALAAHKQGKYTDMHFALMEATALSEDQIQKMAKKVGLNITQFNKDRKAPELDEYLEDSLILANRIPALTGTPFFIINDDYLAGANIDRLNALLEDALKS